ncbi:MAG: hypothetical protein AABZ47_01465 [Planctomycetota bacterium]
MAAVVRIHEAKTDKLKIGQNVLIDVEGVPGKRFPGRVAKIAVVADSQNRWLNPDLKEYETEIAMEKTDVLLKPGVTAHAEIYVESVEDRLAVPVHSVYSKGGKRYVFGVEGNKQLPLEVALGATGTEWVELVKGVTENQVIVTAASEEARRMLPDAGPSERSSKGPPGGGKPKGGENSERRAGPAGTPKPAEQERAAKPAAPPASTTSKGN